MASSAGRAANLSWSESGPPPQHQKYPGVWSLRGARSHRASARTGSSHHSQCVKLRLVAFSAYFGAGVDRCVLRAANLFAVPDSSICASFWCTARPSPFTCISKPNPGAKRGLLLRQQGVGHDDDVAASASGRDDAVENTLWIGKLPFGVIHNKGDVVANKYTITGVLGQGGVGTTYEAETDDGDVVALKAMSLRSMKGWKDLDLFEREARVLKSLKHPGIAAYIDYFQVDTDSDRVFYIAQKVAKGKSVEDLVDSGWRVSEEKVKSIAIEVLSVLQYLGDLRPPVIHRDIKPKNIILDEETGSVKVVDFGAVQDAVASTTLIGSTVVGTYGYMAPEQFQNRSTLQTDLYGLGGTLLYMLSGHSPSYFPQKRLKVDFRNVVSMSPGLADIIERLLEPAPEDRFQSARQTIDALQGFSDVPSSVRSGMSEDPADNGWQPRIVQRPAGTQVDLRRSSSKLEVVIPPAGLTSETVGNGTFSLAWNAFVAFWTGSVITGGGPVLFALFSLPFWFVGFGLVKNTLSSLAVAVRLEFDGRLFYIEWSVGDVWKHRVVGEIQDISSVGIVADEQSGRAIRACMLRAGVQRHVFGSSLESVEQEWLVQEIRSHLQFPPELPVPSRRRIPNAQLRQGSEFEDY